MWRKAGRLPEYRKTGRTHRWREVPFPCPYGQFSSKHAPNERTLTSLAGIADHGCAMPPVTYERERRSSRIFMRIRVLLAGKNQQGRRFRHACETIVINAHGGLLYLDQDLQMGSVLMVTNPFTQDDQECRVVYVGEDSDKGRRVGIEFLSPSPHFWGVEFTQTDWPADRALPLQKN